MNNGTFRIAEAYSRLAMVSSLAKLPATRHTNRSPRPLSKAYSGAMRESAQLNMPAYGFWPPTSASRSALKSWRRDTPSIYLALPFISRASAASGGMSFCGFGEGFASLAKADGASTKPAAPAPTERRKLRRDVAAAAEASLARHVRHMGGPPAG